MLPIGFWLALFAGPAASADAAASGPASAGLPTPALVYPYLIKYVTGEPNAAPLNVGVVRPKVIQLAYDKCSMPAGGPSNPACTKELLEELDGFAFKFQSQRCAFDKLNGPTSCQVIAESWGLATRYLSRASMLDFESAALYFQRACDLGKKIACRQALDSLKGIPHEAACRQGDESACKAASEVARIALKQY